MICVETVTCHTDNHAFLVSRAASSVPPEASSPDACAGVVVVDACQTGPILQALGGRSVCAVLSTHHHPDHVGANQDLADRFPGLPIYALGDQVPGQTHRISDGQVLSLLHTHAIVMQVPGHTHDSVAFHFKEAELVFTGDTLFPAGCGRLFEGTPHQMLHSLRRLAALPPQTVIWSGHAYTKANLRFAKTIEPDNEALLQREQFFSVQRRPGEPSTVALEQATNPFLRTDQPSVRAAASRLPPGPWTDPDQAEAPDALSPVQVFSRLRWARNQA